MKDWSSVDISKFVPEFSLFARIESRNTFKVPKLSILPEAAVYHGDTDGDKPLRMPCTSMPVNLFDGYGIIKATNAKKRNVIPFNLSAFAKDRGIDKLINIDGEEVLLSQCVIIKT